MIEIRFYPYLAFILQTRPLVEHEPVVRFVQYAEISRKKDEMAFSIVLVGEQLKRQGG